MPGASFVRYDGPGTATVVGGWSDDGSLRLPVASTIDLDGDTVVAKVLRTDRPQRAEYEDAGGTLADKLQSAGYRAAVAAPVNVGGHLWGALAAGTRSADPFPEGAEGRLCDFAELVAQALANADAHEQLAASRARLVEAGDAERRRLERNLHDGAQQRLVSVAVNLRVVEANLDKDPPAAREVLSAARDELAQGLDDLRELARGIHPAVLTDRGLGPALESLAVRAPVPVEITELPDERLAGPGRGGRVLRRRRGDHERGQVRARLARDRQRPPLERARHGHRRRRWRRRRGPCSRHGPARARGPSRGARRTPRGGEPGGERHPHQRGDPVSVTRR